MSRLKMHRRAQDALLVFTGGTLGTLGRYLLILAFPVGMQSVFPWPVFVANLLGALLLAIAVGFVTAHGSPTLRQARFRMFFGTGMMGGFTTYSTFALELADFTNSGQWTAGIVYALATLLCGAALSVGGLLIGRAIAK